MAFAGFDLPKVRKLAGELEGRSQAANGLHTDIAAVLMKAGSNLDGKPATTSPELQAVEGSFVPMPFFGRPLPGGLGHELDDMQASMKRRCTQVESLEKLQKAGYHINPDMAFRDEAPADPKKIDAALQHLHDLPGTDFGSNGNRDDLEKMQKELDGLSSAELNAVFDKADPKDLAAYHKLISDTDDSGWKWWDHNGLPDGDRLQHESTMLSKLGPEEIKKFQAAFPDLQPAFDSTDAALDGGKYHYGDPGRPLFTTDANGKPVVSADDVSQGSLGDCWYLSSVIATAQRNPKFIQDGIHENPNGTVSVRVWDKDGNERWITMTKDLPLDDTSGDPLGAQRDGGPAWPAYYEKAFAIAYADDDGGAPDGKDGDDRYDRSEKDSYGDTEWDFTDKAPKYVTGHDSEELDNNLDAVKKAYQDGHPVIVATNATADNPPWGSAYHTRHVYYVKEIKGDTVVLGNPWGPPPANPTLTVTKDQYEKYFNSPQALQVGS